MTTHITSTLDHTVQRLTRLLEDHAPARRLVEGTCSAHEYAAFLEQTYHYVRWTRPLLARAGERLTALGRSPALAEVFHRKAAEETGHERWALSDLHALGRGIRRMAPSVAVQAYIAWNRFTVEAGNPLGFLGTAYVLEALSAGRAQRAVDNLLARSEIPRIHEAVTFLQGHAEADEHHIAELGAMLAEVPDPADQEAIALSARITGAVYGGIFSPAMDRASGAAAVTCSGSSGAREP